MIVRSSNIRVGLHRPGKPSALRDLNSLFFSEPPLADGFYYLIVMVVPKWLLHLQHPDYIPGRGTGNANGKKQVPAELAIPPKAFPEDHLETLTYVYGL